jgi:tricorn protease
MAMKLLVNTLAVLSIVSLSPVLHAASSEGRLLRDPAVGQTRIFFVYADEIWSVAKTGGTAARLTNTGGPKSDLRLSPDGQTIAYSGPQHAIYAIPVAGGSATRLTHNPGTNNVCDWTPDGRVLFMADAFVPRLDDDSEARVRQLFTVAPRGGLPQKLPVPYGAHGSISPDGQWLAYTFYAQGVVEANRRYAGGGAPDIWLLNLRDHRSRQITDWKGTDTFPMWHDKTVYYLSDNGAEGRLNIWSYDVGSGQRRQLTFFKDFDVKWPSIGTAANGHGEIALGNGLDLYLLDVTTKQLRRVHVTIPAGADEKRVVSVDASKFLANWQLSPDGRKSLLEARGDLWVVDNTSGGATNLTHSSASAERDPRWSPDGNWIAYFSDADGEYNLHISRADGSEQRQVTHLGDGFRYRPTWSPDSQRIAFYDSTGSIYVHTRSSGETKRIDQDPLMLTGEVSWSPDSKWLAYVRGASHSTLYSSIWLYSVAEDRSHEVTSGSASDRWPTFDGTGKYLYFVTNRNTRSVTFDAIDYNDFFFPSLEMLLVVPLRADVAAPWEAAADDKKEPSGERALKIDLDGFERRAWIALRDQGSYANLAIAGGERLLFTYWPVGTPGVNDGTPVVKELDFRKSRDPQDVLSGVDAFRLSADGSRILVKNEKGLYVIGASPRQKLDQPLKLAHMTVDVDIRAESEQIFNDAWRIYRDYFYDERMNGGDWPAQRAKYGRLAQQCVRREDVHELIRDMLGELGASHNSHVPPGAELQPNQDVGMLAVDFELDRGAYRIAKIYEGAATDPFGRNPLTSSGVNVHEGDFLLAVNGVPIDVSKDPWAAFEGLSGKSATLTVSHEPFIDRSSRQVTVNLFDRWGAQVRRNRAWVEANRSYVSEKSAGKIGYVYVVNTSWHGSLEFTRQFLTELEKEALIIDTRWNMGGFLPQTMVDALAREPYGYSYVLRRGAGLQTVPQHVQQGPKCMLINGMNESGGDFIADYFRERRLGPLIGTTTAGAGLGFGGISIPYVDGATAKPPYVGYYHANGTLALEGRGVAPDITVIDDPALTWRGGDPQLDTAIQHLLTELEEHPPAPPPTRH